MNDTLVLTALEPLRHPGDAVYSLVRRERRSFLKEFIDVVLAEGLFGNTKDLADNTSAPFFLVASEQGGTIVRVRDGEVVDTLRVGTWSPADKETFKSVNINGHNYRKVARLA